ncbi:MAG: hypothetical protein ABR575_01230 [Actinomycetota bacterium]
MVICDLEAGVGTLLRMGEGQVDVTLVIAETSAKSIEAARRAAEIASGRSRVIVIANRVRDDSDIEAVSAVLGAHEIVAVPEDPAIARADKDGVAPIDASPDAPGVRVITDLAARLTQELVAP